jgi:uncharacterized DUF497 family protein
VGAAVDHERDEAKRRSNRAKHGVDFADAVAFDWDTSLEAQDTRRPYGETRWRSLGLISGTLHMMIYTRRHGRIRVISLRKASRKEKARYAEDKA